MNLFIQIFLVAFVIGVTMSKNCQDIPAGEISEAWYNEIDEGKGWDHPLGSKFEPLKPKFSLGKANKDPKLVGKNRKCFKSNMKIGKVKKEHSFDMDCRYDDFNKPNCVIKTKDNPLVGKLSGNFSFTLSDSEKFAIVYGCVLGKIDYWVSMVPKDTEMTTELRDTILNHVKDVIGMGTEEKDLKSDDDPFLFKSFTGVGCKKEKSEKSGKKEEKKGPVERPDLGGGEELGRGLGDR